ncbi:phage tail tape measure protein [Maribacter sp. R86514]|uniref:phage tail tape measure protein n=1 Tax=Maribacter sp. R86514 TaxID=3093854 RepID=UPI0037CB6D82
MSTATIKIPAEFRAVDRFSHVLKKMGVGTQKFATVGIASIKRFDNKINQSFKAMGKISQLALGLGIGAVFSTAIQSNLDYNESLMSVSSITGATGKNLTILEGHAMDVAKATKMMGKDVLFGFEQIASAQPELLQTPKALAQITKNAITLSKAAKMELGTAADSLTTSLNQFGLGANKSTMAIDALAAGSIYGASKIPETAQALQKFGTIAGATGTKLNESIALVQLVSKFEKGSEAGSKLRNILATMASAKILPSAHLKALNKMGVDLDIVSNAALPFNQRLLEFSKLGKDNTAVLQVLGKENAALGQALFNNASGFSAMLTNVNKAGAAEQQAAINTKSFTERLTAMKNQFLNVTTATNSNNKALTILGSSMDWAANNMETLVGIGAGLLGTYATMKALIWGTQGAIIAYNIALGVQSALSGTASIAIGKNAVALGTYKTIQMATTGATWLATAATTALGVAMNLGLWPILAIVAAVAGVIALFYNWDKVTAWFGKQWGKFTDWIGEAWGNVVNWFKEFDFIGFFKGIGQSILKFLLMPMQQMLKLASNIPGKIGNIATTALGKIGDLTGSGEIAVKNKLEPLDGPEIKAAQRDEGIKNALLKGSLNVNISDPGNFVKSTSSDTKGLPVNLTRTQGAF